MPRSVLTRLVGCVVKDALSVYGSMDVPYFCCSSNGYSHQDMASSTAGTHQAMIRQRGAGRGAASRKITGGISTAKVAAALMPLHKATATADCAAAVSRPGARMAGPATAARTSGMRIHGSIAIGRNSLDSVPSMPSAFGASA